MSYQIYQTKKPMTFVVTNDAAGAEKARKALGDELGELRLLNSIDSLAVVGMAQTNVVEKNLAERGYHVQRTEIRIQEG